MAGNAVATTDDLARLYFSEHLPLWIVAERMGMARATVRRRLSKAGYQLRTGAESRCISTPTAELKRLYFGEQLTVREIADRMGITDDAIRSRLIRGGCKLRPRGIVPVELPLPQEELRRLYFDEQLTTGEIAHRMGMGITPGAVRNCLVRAGCKLRPRRGSVRVKLPQEEIVRLYVNEKLSQRAIAKRFGVADSTICTRLLAGGCTLRPRTQHLVDWRARQKQKLADADRNWRPADWWEKPLEWRIIGDHFLSTDYISNGDLFSWLDSIRILQCPYAETWTDTLNRKKCSENKMKSCSEFIRKIRVWVRKPGKIMEKKNAT